MGDSMDSIMISVMAGAILFLIILFISMYCCMHSKRKRNGEQNDLFSKSTESMIPPIFYTADLKDPLQQDDLREKFRT